MTLTAIKYCRDTAPLSLLDQRLLPASLEYVECRWRLPRPGCVYSNVARRSAEDTAAAIRGMVVRGAPAIGITAAYGLAMAQRAGAGLAEAAALLAASRPTAVNLKWALDRVRTPDPGTSAVTC